MTLLTGPRLLSPATRPLAVPSIGSERVDQSRHAMDPELVEAQSRRAAAEKRLEDLRAEHAAALAAMTQRQRAFPREPEPAPSSDDLRFDARLPQTPVKLVPPSGSRTHQ